MKYSVSGNSDDVLSRITVTSAVAVCCVTAPGTEGAVLSSSNKEVAGCSAVA